MKEKREERKRKGIEVQRIEHPTPSWAIDALIGDEEQNGKREQKERNREQIPNPASLGHLVAFYDVQGSNGKPILSTPTQPTGGILINRFNK